MILPVRIMRSASSWVAWFRTIPNWSLVLYDSAFAGPVWTAARTTNNVTLIMFLSGFWPATATSERRRAISSPELVPGHLAGKRHWDRTTQPGDHHEEMIVHGSSQVRDAPWGKSKRNIKYFNIFTSIRVFPVAGEICDNPSAPRGALLSRLLAARPAKPNIRTPFRERNSRQSGKDRRFLAPSFPNRSARSRRAALKASVRLWRLVASSRRICFAACDVRLYGDTPPGALRRNTRSAISRGSSKASECAATSSLGKRV